MDLDGTLPQEVIRKRSQDMHEWPQSFACHRRTNVRREREKECFTELLLSLVSQEKKYLLCSITKSIEGNLRH